MAQSFDCPKCGTDISESYEPEDWSVGIRAGWYCDACDEGFGDDGEYEPLPGDVPLMTVQELLGDRPLGTPLSQLSSQPGPKDDPDHPDHVRYAEFCRIARSWGYE